MSDDFLCQVQTIFRGKMSFLSKCGVGMFFLWWLPSFDQFSDFNPWSYFPLPPIVWLCFQKIARKQKLVKCGFIDQTATLPSDIEIPFWLERSISHELCFRQAPVKTNQEIYENSMLEDDPDTDKKSKEAVELPRWGPQHKGAQTLANFYSSGELHVQLQLACNYQSWESIIHQKVPVAKSTKVPTINETL